jgi:death-on-curing protein
LQYLTEDDVIAFYREVIGEPVRRYAAGLSSAVGRPQQSAFGEDAYPTLSLQAAALMRSLAENQPFVDGNKRIAWISGKAFLRFHGLGIQLR